MDTKPSVNKIVGIKYHQEADIHDFVHFGHLAWKFFHLFLYYVRFLYYLKHVTFSKVEQEGLKNIWWKLFFNEATSSTVIAF